jgi:hypothetical protein
MDTHSPPEPADARNLPALDGGVDALAIDAQELGYFVDGESDRQLGVARKLFRFADAIDQGALRHGAPPGQRAQARVVVSLGYIDKAESRAG